MDLVIDLISFVEGKSYGFQEYILNLLDDFSSLRKEIRVEKIILLINQTQHSFFSKNMEMYSNIIAVDLIVLFL